MEEVKQQPEDTYPTQARSVPNPIPTLPLTKEEKITLKESDPLKYVKLMMALRGSSSYKSASGAST